MAYSVKATYLAKNHFRGHVGYIVDVLQNPDAALRLWDALDETIQELSDHPQTAPYCVDPALSSFGYRKQLLLNSHYLCICRIEGDIVWIEGVYHEKPDYEHLLLTGH